MISYHIGKCVKDVDNQKSYKTGMIDGKQEVIADAVFNNKATYIGGGSYYWND